MKIIKLYLLFLTGTVISLSCKKDNNNGPTTIASLNVINAAIDVPSVNVNFTNNPIPFYLYQQPVYYGSNFEWGISSGDSAITIVSSADTMNNLYSGNLNLSPGGIYSLYLIGQLPKVSVLFVQDTIPLHSDSTSGLRFINLSPLSQPMSINLQGDAPDQMQFSNLEYGKASGFKTYPATNGIYNYTFEVRDQATGDLLTTVTWNLTLFKNNTLVICGLEDPAASTLISTFQINNY